MAKNSWNDYDSTAANNTDIGGVDAQGTAPASNMDDLVRELASHTADVVSGTTPVKDTITFADPVDLTKRFRFDGGNVSAGQTRVVSLPDANVTIPSGTLVTETAAQTLTSKDISSATNTYRSASTTATGAVELATDAEAQTGTDTARAITPANLQAVTATETRKGVVELATTAEAAAGTDTARAVTPAGLSARFVLGTAQATTSGTTKDFTSIPSWVQRISVNFSGLSTSGSSVPLIQIGDSGGIEATGYLGSGSAVSSGTTAATYTTGFGLGDNHGASFVLHGRVTLELLDAATNTWTASGVLGLSGSGWNVLCAGSKSLSATLDRVRITTVNGTDTFDAGSVNIMYE